VPRIAARLVMAAGAALALALGALPSTPAQATSLNLVGGPAATSSFASSSGLLIGANDWSCRPSAARPRPVVLMHGTFLNMTEWQALAPRLSAAGYCVFALNYGCEIVNGTVCATGFMEDSALQLRDFVDRVLGATGAKQVDIVGHSQGGMLPRYYMKFLGGAAKVHQLVGLAPSNHGTTVDGLQILIAEVNGLTGACNACQQQLVGSAFMTRLNAGGDTLPGVRYTVIETDLDEVVTPYQSAFLKGPAVTNILLQNTCLLDLTGHITISLDPNALGWVDRALDPTVRAPRCTLFPLPL
jgi:triacylglycerol esterase/lipase EstA (alpha/beta hydrolase family)